MKKLLVLFALTASVALIVSAADAAKPTRFPLVAGPLVLTGVCPFPIEIDIVANRQTVTDFSSGKETILGDFVGRVTNLADPTKSLQLNIPGPLFITPNADGTFTLKGTGRNIFYFFANQLGPGEPGALLLLTGKTTELFDAGFNLVPGSFEHSGGVQNLCPVLA